jgi:hypothetical protein
MILVTSSKSQEDDEPFVLFLHTLSRTPKPRISHTAHVKYHEFRIAVRGNCQTYPDLNQLPVFLRLQIFVLLQNYFSCDAGQYFSSTFHNNIMTEHYNGPVLRMVYCLAVM